MHLDNYIKRKYPKHYEAILAAFDHLDLSIFLKEYKYRIGTLKADNGDNKAGDFVMYKRCKEIIGENENGYEYPNEGGWTGQFEYRYKFAKPSDLYQHVSYRELFNPLV